MSNQSQSLSNSQFLSHLFPHLPETHCAWVCAFPGDPSQQTGRQKWTGFGLQAANFPTFDSVTTGTGGHLNTFVTFSAFRGEPDGRGQSALLFPGRRNALFAGMYALMLDDLGDGPGAKLPLEEHLAKLSPSWVLETSPRNHQVGYLFTGPIGDRQLAAAFINAMIYEGLLAEDDPGMAGVTRYGRLPVGWNGKARYGSSGFHHRLIHWNPETRYAPRQIAESFGIDWEASVESKIHASGSGVHSRDFDGADTTPAERAWMEVLARAVGRFEGPNDKGLDGIWYDCTCPWVASHTDGVDNGSAYRLGGGFECHHGHCHDRTWQDVRQWLLEHEDSDVRGRALNLVGQEAFDLEWLEAPRRENFGEPVSVFHQARALTMALNKDTEPRDIQACLQQIAGWVAEGHLNRVELSTLKKDVVDATALTKGDVTDALKPLIVRQRTLRNVEQSQKTLETEVQNHTGKKFPPVPLVPSFPLKLGQSDTPALASDNLKFILRQVNVDVAYNQMRQRKQYTGLFSDWSLDWVGSWLRDACTLNGLMGANEVIIKRMTDKLAEERAFHPFEQWLNCIQWDGHRRVEQLYDTIHVAPDKVKLRNLIVHKWLCSVVAAARHLYKGEPGLQPRGVIVLAGSQRKGKSTWFARLFQGLFPHSRECFIGGASFGNDKDSKMAAGRSLVIEWGELDTTFRRAELGALKAFISQPEDSYRKPWAAEFVDISRRSVFAGTVNDPQFLRDRTGNSRFWTIPILDIDLDRQRMLSMTQIWAEIDRFVQVESAKASAEDSYSRPWLMSERQTEYVETHNAGHRDRSDMEIWMSELFRWDDPDWLQAGLDDRLHMNPMMITQIADIVGVKGRTGHNMTLLKNILRDMTGQLEPVNTSRHIHGRRMRGRFWGMPPLMLTIEEKESMQAASMH